MKLLTVTLCLLFAVELLNVTVAVTTINEIPSACIVLAWRHAHIRDTISTREVSTMLLSASFCLLIIGLHRAGIAHLLIHVMRTEYEGLSAQRACFLTPAYLPVTY